MDRCPNCNRDHNNLKIYRCNRCGLHFCKKCNNGSTIVHHNCSGMGSAGTIEVGIVNETGTTKSNSSYPEDENSGCLSKLWKIIKVIFVIIVIIIVLAIIFGS